MKPLLCLLFFSSIATLSFGQCDKDVVLTTSKTEYMNGSCAVQRSEDEKSVIEIDKSKIVITPGNSDRKMIGTIQSTTCDWSKPYQEGKTIIKAAFDSSSGGKYHATLTTEGKAEGITVLMEIDEMPDEKIRATVTSFKENKRE